MLERDDFANRFAANEPISVSELLYPLMQAYDSVAIEADVELGGTDQLYNLLTGRDVMEAYGLEPQVVLTTPLINSWDGTKMSGSRGNYIGLLEAPEEQFGKAMRFPDEMLPELYRLIMEEDAPAEDPMEAKLSLARWIVARSHGEEAAQEAEEHFTRVVRRGEAPEDVPVVEVDRGLVYVPKVLADAFGNSVSYWRRLMAQGAVRLEGALPLTEFNVPSEQLDGRTLFAGKRQFLRIVVRVGD
jgi:tyrosyl-tRNA synthetase